MCRFDKICVIVGFKNLSVKKYMKSDTKDVESHETQIDLTISATHVSAADPVLSIF